MTPNIEVRQLKREGMCNGCDTWLQRRASKVITWVGPVPGGRYAQLKLCESCFKALVATAEKENFG